MALFNTYAPPGVYTSVVIQPASAPLFGSARIPVIIGEGVQNFVFSNEEIFRGSSATADDQSVNEDISAQVTGLNNTFQVTYFPVVTGTGKGVVTNDPSLIQVTANGIPVTVISLNGAAGSFVTQQIIPAGTSLLVTYFFKRTDTLITNEDLSAQVPQFASFTYAPSTPAVSGAATAHLLTAAAYAILASAGVTSSVSTNVAGGNVGSYPTNTITGTFNYTSPAMTVTAVAQNQTDLAAAYAFFNGLTSTAIGASFATTTFTATAAGYAGGPGFVGNASSTLHFTGGTVTLDGAGLTNPVFVFQVGSALNIDTAATTINLINGATADNVIWIVGSAATFDAHNHAWAGTIIAVSAITLNSTSLSTLSGRALVTTGPVTISNTTSVTVPVSAGVPFTGQPFVIGLTIPGGAGNTVTLAFTYTPGSGKSDALAVSGAGSNTISIELLEADNVTIRRLVDISALIAAGIPTGSGYLTGSSTNTMVGAAQAASSFTGGAGPNTNTVFKTHFVPIVDGTNGGVVTTTPSDVTVLVGGVAATVTALDGAHGLFTLATGVVFGSTLTITYYTNTWQNTFDLLPGNNINAITEVGLGPNRADFTQNVDYVLNDNKIYWGASTMVSQGVDTAGSTAFGPVQITPTLIDENVYLVPARGAANGVNTVFTSAFIPVDGSGLSRTTDNPAKILVYVGPDPITAFDAGAVTVAQLSGASGTITLYNPPSNGQNVYVSGYRNILNDNNFTLEVETPGIPGQGTYSITDQLGRNVPATSIGTNVVAQSGPFTETGGIVWPFNSSDFEAAIGGASETITLTFQQDGYTSITVPATQAHITAPIAAASVTIHATTTGPAADGTSVTFLAAGPATVNAVSVYNNTSTFSSGVATPFATWQASHAYTLGQMIFDPTTSSLQVVTSAGTSGLVKPSFNGTMGMTTPDGSPPDMIWTSNGAAPANAETIYANIVGTSGFGSPFIRTVSQIISLITNSGVSTPHAGVIVISATGTTSGNATQFTFILTGGLNATTSPAADRFVVTSSRTLAQANTDHLGRTGNATTPSYPNFASRLYAHLTLFNLGDTIIDTNGNIQKVTTAGTSGASSPVWATSGTTTDGSVTWTFVGPLVGTNNFLGETYIDANTAVKFTIVDPFNALAYGYVSLPSPGYQFEPGDTLQLVVTEPGIFTTGTQKIIAIPGIKITVQTTFGMVAGNTAIIDTFNKSGNDPNVGEFYYVSFTTAKQPSDYAIQIFSQASDAYALYGQPNTQNRASLGVELLTQNGAQQFGVVQVPVQTGLGVASDASFIDAIQSLATPLPGGGDVFAGVIVPLSTSATVQSFLSRFLITQASPRIQAEGIGFVGFNQFTTPTQARQAAQSFHNSRIIAVAPFVAGVLINPTDNTGPAVEYAVSGEFLAAALAGLNVNPANDVATTLTNQQVVGFSRLLGPALSDPTMDQMAADGLTLLVPKAGALNVRHYKSTDPSNVITSEPTATTVTDYVRQQFRTGLDQFIGRKFVGTLVNDVTAVCNALLRLLVNQEIIAGYKNLTVIPDPSDPTLLDITVSFQPIFSLLYISVTFTVTTNL
jgi:hypothetical protein